MPGKNSQTTRRRILQAAALSGAGAAVQTFFPALGGFAMAQDRTPMLILYNGKITTLDDRRTEATAIAIANGRVLATGSDEQIMRLAKTSTRVIDLNKRRVIPGLNDSHTHLVRGGLNYNMELRWEGVPSLAMALGMLKRQAERTPAPQWVRVVGGWSEFQFAERRMPSLAEINRAAPDTPAFILHLYGRALLNQAAPDWSPVNEFGGYYGLPQGTRRALAGASLAVAEAAAKNAVSGTCCASACSLHGHKHSIAWGKPIPVAANARNAFWGALGCSCFAV